MRDFAALDEHRLRNGNDLVLVTPEIGDEGQFMSTMAFEVIVRLALEESHPRFHLEHVRAQLTDEQDNDADVREVNADLRHAPLETLDMCCHKIEEQAEADRVAAGPDKPRQVVAP